MGGALLTNISLQTFYKKEEYRPLLYMFITIAAMTPIVSLLFSFSPIFYAITFLFSGAAIELYKIVTPGVLIGYMSVFILTSLYIILGFNFAKSIVCARFSQSTPLQ